MSTRRAFSVAAIGTATGGLLVRTGLTQPVGQQPQGTESLRNRGTPGGRIGTTIRSDPGDRGALALELVAPLREVGLTSSDQPSLYYLLSGRATQPMRLAISTPGRSRPLADLDLPHPRSAGVSVVRLRDHGVRLTPSLIHVWSVELKLDPDNPSRDLVGSAPIEYRPADPALERALREVPPERRYAVLARAGYWYDAVELAQVNRDHDGGAALNALFVQEELPMAAESRPAPSWRR
jgi:Domain of Unknown Function (DUF928)